MPALEAVWAAGFKTLGCCCGHGSGTAVISIEREVGWRVMGCIHYTEMFVETYTPETWPDGKWPFMAPQVHLNCAVHDWIDWKRPTKFSTQFKAEIARTTAERLNDTKPCLPAMMEGFMCGSGLRGCTTCGLPAAWLCDFPLGDGKTCDADLCKWHRRKVETEIDLCPIHALMVQPGMIGLTHPLGASDNVPT